jgi:hypothetical protein
MAKKVYWIGWVGIDVEEESDREFIKKKLY